MKILILTGPVTEIEQRFEALNERLSAALGYPTPDQSTKQYTSPFPHPTGESIAVVIEEPVEAHLTEEEQAALQPIETLVQGGYSVSPLFRQPSWWERFKGWWRF
jgi:hypothetical protein